MAVDPGYERELAFWQNAAVVCFASAFVLTAIAAVWFAMINYVGNELYHPLDFFSNKLRTRPYWFALTIVGVGLMLLIDTVSGEMDALTSVLPELAVAQNLQGFVSVVSMMYNESAGAALVTMLLHQVFSKTMVLIITVATPPKLFSAGVMYSNGYFVANMFCVTWIQFGFNRLRSKKLLPGEVEDPEMNKKSEYAGAERLPQIWGKTVLFGNPFLMIITDIMFLAVFLIARQEYGKALTICYFIIVTFCIVGCCSQYRAGTAVE